MSLAFVELGYGRGSGLKSSPYLLRIYFLLVVKLILIIRLCLDRLDALLLIVTVPQIHYGIIVASVVAHSSAVRILYFSFPSFVSFFFPFLFFFSFLFTHHVHPHTYTRSLALDSHAHARRREVFPHFLTNIN